MTFAFQAVKKRLHVLKWTQSVTSLVRSLTFNYFENHKTVGKTAM